jgi:hypothetical protein
MSGRDGRNDDAVRRLALALALILTTAALVFSLEWFSGISGARREAERDTRASCAEGANCEQKSLRLQARELASTEAGFTVAFWQLIVSLAGLAAVSVTVIYAHHAWKEAKRAADIADRALGALERPFLVLQVVESGIEVSEDSTSYGKTTYQLVNFGRTPAILTRRHFAMTWSVPEPIDPQSNIGQRIAFGVVIGAGRESPTYEVGSAVPLNSALREHGKGRKRERREPYLIGFVQYRDLMGHEYVTGFCLEHERGAFDLSSWARPGEEDRYNYDRKLT